jgi:hypothetical protein
MADSDDEVILISPAEEAEQAGKKARTQLAFLR